MKSIAISNSVSTVTDYIYVYDGLSTTSPLVAVLSGAFTGTLPSFVSSQPNMLVRFVSDNSTVYTGFNLTYTTVTPQG